MMEFLLVTQARFLNCPLVTVVSHASVVDRMGVIFELAFLLFFLLTFQED